ncbi:MAG: purine-nucleoside phosphorylase [Prolixibacteraceae bacterium]|jgi:purine-nucleoside phosphorylase|nr:purine-nucleoside phosphorylase [Prolixibacteraceae bacterium]MBT6006640.1 purine-nucleoside phosphorylase [Prolixibacteraceae bacterium]MBT6765155.1 purine-nucleoside phosphorylase [Prolixibacteraceae bacterium]MBT7000337.1 purine-nucleoside phosphorylase [Prolixibacteraceae bacterium]MBT7395417.1 purine-nucleoside phosphorylase [Prolixibacteraceae bacterium]
MLEKIKATANFIKERINSSPEIGIILGTGLGGLVNEIEIIDSIPYGEIPNFPISTVEGHAGRLIYGKLGNKEILAMQGRFHYYEGYSMLEVTFPVRVLKLVGITSLFVSNASGGLNPDFQVGEIVLITDHINFFPEHPLRGKNEADLGTRFPDMSRCYDERLRHKAKLIALENNVTVREGVYAGVSGPTFETPAEYKMFRILGGDLVGMSTVPEVIVARHMNLKVFGISIVTDSGVPGEIVEVSHEEVQEVAMKAEPKMTLIMKKLIESL